jgi:hypothetical protein
MNKYVSFIYTVMFGTLIVTGCATGNNNIPSDNSTANHSPMKVINTIQRIDPKTTVGNHHFDHADSIWLDGLWSEHRTGLVGNKYVISFMGTGKNGARPNQPFITVYNEDEAPYVAGIEWVNYVCPRHIGHLIITSITSDGTVVHFTSSKKIHGTLNLTTHHWTFIN